MRAWLERHPTLAALLAGVVTAAALPPLYLLPALAGFGVLVAVLHRHGTGPVVAFVRGTAFGFGFFLAGLYWVGIAFFADAERFGIYAVPAVLGLALFLALSVGVAAGLVALRRWRSVTAHALAFAVAWTLAEPLRGGLGLQFPWNPIASVWAVSDASLQAVAFTGTYGLSLLTVAAASLTAPLFMTGAGVPRAAIVVPRVARERHTRGWRAASGLGTGRSGHGHCTADRAGQRGATSQMGPREAPDVVPPAPRAVGHGS